MIKEPDGFAELVDNLREELAQSRDEVLNLISIIHHYESMLLSFHLQVKLNYLDKVHIDKAVTFAERVNNKTLKTLYNEQNSITQINPDLVEFLSLLNDKPKKEEIH
jgi:hypothetical protein|tara:strand:+ start:711 stop:1031 length:321 start_codon:yes stop_codon:yes gene_type:complete